MAGGRSPPSPVAMNVRAGQAARRRAPARRTGAGPGPRPAHSADRSARRRRMEGTRRTSAPRVGTVTRRANRDGQPLKRPIASCGRDIVPAIQEAAARSSPTRLPPRTELAHRGCGWLPQIVPVFPRTRPKTSQGPKARTGCSSRVGTGVGLNVPQVSNMGHGSSGKCRAHSCRVKPRVRTERARRSASWMSTANRRTMPSPSS
jgi:hypothetical protein